MAQRKAFPLRLDPEIFDALQRWANAELRSVNAQIEFLLRRSLQQAGFLPEPKSPSPPERRKERKERT
jgi:hypothetical protein